MNVRLRKRVKVGAKAAINIGKTGASLSVGLGMLTLNIGMNGVTVSATPVPGVTLQERKKWKKKK